MDPKLLPFLRRAGATLLVLVLPVAILIRVATSQPAPPAPLDPGFHAAADRLTPSERAGREIWFKATAGNDRFHTYVFQQRLGVLIDWFRVLRSSNRNGRFRTWGIINDPECCTPGSIAELPEEEPRRDVRIRLLPGRRRPAGACRQGRLPRSRVRLPGRANQPETPAWRQGSETESL